ncbi:hypothetical protein ACFQY9_34870 [Microvirga aerilata]|uniref:hypothetical protein n=1 Tax=Microvirga aerilata TaxID=670292 RepID=UPI00363B612A
MNVTWQSVRIGSGFTREEVGRLVFVDGRLAAILVCRSDHDEPIGRSPWFIDAGFGPIAGLQETFPSFEDAATWILRRFKNWEYLMRWNHASD